MLFKKGATDKIEKQDEVAYNWRATGKSGSELLELIPQTTSRNKYLMVAMDYF